MPSDFVSSFFRIQRVPAGTRALGSMLAAALLAACGTAGTATADRTLPTTSSPSPQGPTAGCTAVAFYQAPSALQTAELRYSSAAAAGERPPVAQIERAVLLGQAGNGDLRGALLLLDAVLESRAPEAIELHPLARLLAAQFAERQRLEAVTDRLTQQLERTGQELKVSQRRTEDLQRKLDALTDIERSLPARPQASPPAESPDRRTP